MAKADASTDTPNTDTTTNATNDADARAEVEAQAAADSDVAVDDQPTDNQPRTYSTVSHQEARMADEGLMLEWLDVDTEDVSELHNRVVQAEYDEAHRDGGPRQAVLERCHELRVKHEDRFPGKPA